MSAGKYSPYVVGIILFFVVLACVNGFILYLGVTTSSDLMDESPYEQGLVYQQKIDGLQRTQDAGLLPKLTLSALAPTGERDAELVLANSVGEKVSGANILLSAKRPDDASLDIKIELTEQKDNPGVYSQVVSLPAAGLWLMSLEIEIEGKLHLWEEKRFL